MFCTNPLKTADAKKSSRRFARLFRLRMHCVAVCALHGVAVVRTVRCFRFRERSCIGRVSSDETNLHSTIPFGVRRYLDWTRWNRVDVTVVVVAVSMPRYDVKVCTCAIVYTILDEESDE